MISGPARSIHHEWPGNLPTGLLGRRAWRKLRGKRGPARILGILSCAGGFTRKVYTGGPKANAGATTALPDLSAPRSKSSQIGLRSGSSWLDRGSLWQALRASQKSQPHVLTQKASGSSGEASSHCSGGGDPSLASDDVRGRSAVATIRPAHLHRYIGIGRGARSNHRSCCTHVGLNIRFKGRCVRDRARKHAGRRAGPPRQERGAHEESHMLVALRPPIPTQPMNQGGRLRGHFPEESTVKVLFLGRKPVSGRAQLDDHCRFRPERPRHRAPTHLLAARIVACAHCSC